MTRTLVTGAAGFTGRYLTTLLADRGHEVHAVVHHEPDAPIADASAAHEADLANHAVISRVVNYVRPDHVVHLAAIAFVGHDDVEEMYRANVVGTRQLLDALSNLAEPPKSVVLASSANVYGNAREGMLDETMLPAPANDYGVSKVAAEMVAGLYRSQLPISIVRPFNYTGVGQAAEFLIPKIVQHVRARSAAIRLGNLEIARDFSDVRFVAEAYCRLLDCPAAVGRTVNVSSGKAYRLEDILDKVSSIAGYRLEVEVDPVLVRGNEVRKLWGDSSLLDELIGPIDRIPIEDTLRWMIEA